MSLLQKYEKGPFCHSERSTELTPKACRRITANQTVRAPFDILRQAQDDIVMVSLSNHQGDKFGLLQEAHMRTLLYVPIIHTSADLGSLAKDVTKRGVADLGEAFWKRHEKTIEGFWSAIMKYFDSIEVSNFKIYQDGMVADGEVGQKIVEEGIKVGSKNYELVSRLLQKGAILVKTEDFALVKRERDYLVELTKAKTRMEKLIAYLKYRLIKNELLKERDRFIANRINETLNQGETGILFIGAYHDIIPKLAKDIQVREIKDTKKIREYQEALHHRKINTKRFEELSKYLSI